jgi:hypothetical protein
MTRVWDERDQGLLDVCMVLSFRETGRDACQSKRTKDFSLSDLARYESTQKEATAHQDFAPFEEEEDVALIGLVERIMNRWKRISAILGQRVTQLRIHARLK